MPWQVVAGFGPIRQVEQRVAVDAALGGHDPRRRRIEFTDHREHPGQGAIVGEVGLVDHHEIGDRDVAADLRMAHMRACGGDRIEHVHEPAVPNRRIGDPSHHPDQCTRFGDPTGLHDYGVQPRRRGGEPAQRLGQAVGVDGAAQTAVSETDGPRTLPRHQQRVDVDGPEVVDDHSQARPGRVAEQRVEQRRLTGTQKSGDDDDRDRPPVAARAHDPAGTAPGTHSGHTTRSSRPSRSG